jgi:hypothetical protein
MTGFCENGNIPVGGCDEFRGYQLVKKNCSTWSLFKIS